ncbi:hypothetical protein D3C78_1106190 [compost metagenome]
MGPVEDVDVGGIGVAGPIARRVLLLLAQPVARSDDQLMFAAKQLERPLHGNAVGTARMIVVSLAADLIPSARRVKLHAGANHVLFAPEMHTRQAQFPAVAEPVVEIGLDRVGSVIPAIPLVAQVGRAR